MDISTILPLLMQQKGGGDERMTAMVQALSAARGGNGEAAEQAKGANISNIISAMNGGKADPAGLLTALTAGKDSGQNPNMNLVNLLTTMNSGKRKKKSPYGMKPVKAFIPDEILGKIIKFFNK